MSTVNSDIYTTNHKGQEIYVNWQLQKYEVNQHKSSYTERVGFDYNNIEVIGFIKKERILWYNYVELMCNMIDKLGKEKFNTFKSYYDEIDSLSERYIIIDDKVYKPYINDSIRSGDLIFYMIYLKMSDNKTFDGKTRFNEDGMNPYHKEQANKDELIKNIRYDTQNYYKKYSILPNEKEHLLPKKTEHLKNMIKWLDENNIDLRWLYEK